MCGPVTISSRPKCVYATFGLKVTWHFQPSAAWRRVSDAPKGIDGLEETISDTHQTAAARLLNAGPMLAEIANCMGQSVRYATQVIEY